MGGGTRRDILRLGAGGAALGGLAACASSAPYAGAGPMTAGWSPGAGPMSHRQRIEAALEGAPTDRLPFGFWQHFPNQDRSPSHLAQLTVDMQRAMDLDFLKLGPYGLYSVVDWGTVLDVRGGMQTPIVAEYGVKEPGDWRKLKVIDPSEGEYAVVLAAQRMTLAQRDNDAPLVTTVFNPMTSAAKLAGRDTLLEHLREHPADVEAGLDVITETTRRFVRESIRQGADGLFFASQWTDHGVLTPDEYRTYVKPRDLAVLDAQGRNGWFTMLHFHRNAMWELIADYPVAAFNLPDYGDDAFSIDQLQTMTDKTLITGVPSGLRGGGYMLDGGPAEIGAAVQAAWKDGARRGVIFAPDGVVNVSAPASNLQALSGAVRATSRA